MARRVIRGATVVTPEQVAIQDIAIVDGLIEAIGGELPAGDEETNGEGLHILPAVIDIHVHFNEPGRTEWEGAATGSRAAAAGGAAAYFDMPLNSTPCTVNAFEFNRKRTALEASSITDFALWGGLVPSSLDHMEELVECGVIGFKAFMCDSGLPEFPHADYGTLKKGLIQAAKLGVPIAVHAENHDLTCRLSKEFKSQGRTSIRDFLESRPVAAEVDAIVQAAELAGEAGAKLHIVHVSSGTGVVAAAEARSRGVDVSIETCGHYLFFTESDIERLGAIAKCTPPIRDGQQQEHLWQLIESGVIDAVVSDHSPSPMSMKTDDFWNAWGGIAGVQSTLAVMLERGYHGRALSLSRIAALTAGWPALRFELGTTGSLQPGYDANLTIVDLSRTSVLKDSDLQQRHKFSPYLGYEFRGTIVETIRRGETIFKDGQITAKTGGKLLRPGGNTNA